MSHPNDLIRPYCVVCLKPATNLHHEPPKGLGGVGCKGIEPAVISLCGSGTTGCHGKRHAQILKIKYENEWIYKHEYETQWHKCATFDGEFWEQFNA